MHTPPPIPALEPAFACVADLGPLQDHGMTRVGHRRVIPVVGGSITGTFEGTLLAGGADWQTVRADGSIEIDGRYSARGDDGSPSRQRRAGGERSGQSTRPAKSRTAGKANSRCRRVNSSAERSAGQSSSMY